MRRAGNLYHLIHTWDNLLLAFYNAQRNKSAKSDVRLFAINLEANLEALQVSLMRECVEVGGYHYFKVHDPKERMICAASFPQRVLHHAIIRITEPYFEKQMIFDNYACLKGKGTDRALIRAFEKTRQSNWFLKLDIRKYFDSIDHQILFNSLRKMFKDNKLLSLFHRIIKTYETKPGKGLPIGNLTSQYFANFYLSGFDHLIKDELGVKSYVRYMDDMCLWGKSKLELAETRDILAKYLQTELKLELKHAVLNQSVNGVPFLGHLIKPTHIYLLRSKRTRIRRKIAMNYRKLMRLDYSQEEFSAHMLPVVEHAHLAKARRWIYHICQRYDQRLEPC